MDTYRHARTNLRTHPICNPHASPSPRQIKRPAPRRRRRTRCRAQTASQWTRLSPACHLAPYQNVASWRHQTNLTLRKPIRMQGERLNKSVSVKDSASFPVGFQHKASSKFDPSGLVSTRTSFGAEARRVSRWPATFQIHPARTMNPRHLHALDRPRSWDAAAPRHDLPGLVRTSRAPVPGTCRTGGGTSAAPMRRSPNPWDTGSSETAQTTQHYAEADPGPADSARSAAFSGLPIMLPAE